MASQICRTLLTKLTSPNFLSSAKRSSIITSHRKLYSSNKAELIEVDLESSDIGNSGDVEVVGGMKRLEDAIHTIVVRRLAPAWLPLRPGSSYWVPPRPNSGGIVELVGKLTNPLSEEESLSLSSARGWPSSSFFLDQGPLPVVEVHVYTGKPEKESQSEDEE